MVNRCYDICTVVVDQNRLAIRDRYTSLARDFDCDRLTRTVLNDVVLFDGRHVECRCTTGGSTKV